MPELPEVTRVQYRLEPILAGQRVGKVRIYSRWVRIPNDLRERLFKQRCQEIIRHGKYLFFIFKSEVLMVHLGMSGAFRIVPVGQRHKRNDHYSFLVNNTSDKIIYSDPRRFGQIKWCPIKLKDKLQSTELVDLPEFNLGIDALNSGLNPKHESSKILWREWFFKKFLPTSPVKFCLLQQRGIAGIGNIYASEILFASRIHPSTPIGDLTKYQQRQIVKHCWGILRNAIKYGGTTIDAPNRYQDPDQQEGGFGQYLAVYGREGEPCQICNRPIKRLQLKKRATYYCSHCQPAL